MNVACVADDVLFERFPDAGKPRKLSQDEKERHDKAMASLMGWLEDRDHAIR